MHPSDIDEKRRADGASGPRRIALATGGTAGHVTPALAVAAAYQAARPDVSVVFFGRVSGFEQHLLDAQMHRFEILPGAPFYGVSAWGRRRTLSQLVSGIRCARRALARDGVHMVIGFGGYASYTGRVNGCTFTGEMPRFPLTSSESVVRVTQSAAAAVRRLGARPATGLPRRLPGAGGLESRRRAARRRRIDRIVGDRRSAARGRSSQTIFPASPCAGVSAAAPTRIRRMSAARAGRRRLGGPRNRIDL